MSAVMDRLEEDEDGAKEEEEGDRGAGGVK